MASQKRVGYASFVPATSKRASINLADERKKFPQFHKPSRSAIHHGGRSSGMSGGGPDTRSRGGGPAVPVDPLVLDRGLASSTEIMASSIENIASEA